LTCPLAHDIEISNATGLPDLFDLAREHIATQHAEIVDGEVVAEPLALPA
jgi:hypothetical protein